MLICPQYLEQTRFAKLSILVFRFGNAVAVGHKQVLRMQLHGLFFIRNIVQQPDHSSALIEPANVSTLAQDHGGEMASVAVGQPPAAAVEDAEEHGGVLFRR